MFAVWQLKIAKLVRIMYMRLDYRLYCLCGQMVPLKIQQNRAIKIAKILLKREKWVANVEILMWEQIAGI